MKHLRQYIRQILKESPRDQIASDLLQSGDLDQKEYDSVSSLLNHKDSDFRKQGIQFLEIFLTVVINIGFF